MVIRDSDLQIRKTSHTAGGKTSLGGSLSAEVVNEGLNNLWDEIQDAELSSSVVGEYEVRCVGIYNNSPNNEIFEDLQVYVDQNTAAPFTDVDIALGIAAYGDDEQTVASEDVLPRDVYFTFARGEENALAIGNISKGSWKALWIRRHAGPTRSGSSYPRDNYVLGFKIRGTAGTSVPPTEPGGPSANDRFGIRMIYPTKPEQANVTSSPFYLKMADAIGDVRFDPQAQIARNADGSWRVVGDTGCKNEMFYRRNHGLKQGRDKQRCQQIRYI